MCTIVRKPAGVMSQSGFTRSLAREVGGLGITVNDMAPEFLATDMTAALRKSRDSRSFPGAALRRLAEVEDVANAVDYLLGDRARNISGAVITIDAGATA
jgi:3-oxoacyl-[acyl-carrier protein] reductase